ncbi:MAG: ABC transporter permease [Bacteroidetes bacterium]|nr:ABC transporter permease [Bacteroidota bacterium]
MITDEWGQSRVWTRFRKNWFALAAAGWIALNCLMALMAYWWMPDQSPYANRIILEIGGEKPGYTQSFLLVNKQQLPTPVSGWERLLNGTPDAYEYIPISEHSISGDSIWVQKRIDESLSEPMVVAKSTCAPKPIQTQTFWLGTDKYGRDILSRILLGTRVSLSVGLITILLSIGIGGLLGSLAGYLGGKIDRAIMWFINVMWSIPTLLLVFAITLTLGKGFWQIFIAIGLTMWVNVARLVRAQVMTLKQLEFIEATRVLGLGPWRTIFRHIFPNIIGPVTVLAASNFAASIVIEAGLSFLGIGVQPPMPSWGLIMKENYNFIITQNPMLALAPGLAIMLLVLSFNILGNGLRDALDVRSTTT